MMDIIDIKSVVVVDEDVEPDRGATNRGYHAEWKAFHKREHHVALSMCSQRGPTRRICLAG